MRQRRAASLFLALTMALGLAAPAAGAAEAAPAPGAMTYTEVIAPQYEDAGTFHGGLAAVKQGGKWGYIDAQGEVAIPFQYDLAGEFSEGWAVVAQLRDTSFRPGRL